MAERYTSGFLIKDYQESPEHHAFSPSEYKEAEKNTRQLEICCHNPNFQKRGLGKVENNHPVSLLNIDSKILGNKYTLRWTIFFNCS